MARHTNGVPERFVLLGAKTHPVSHPHFSCKPFFSIKCIGPTELPNRDFFLNDWMCPFSFLKLQEAVTFTV